MSHKKKLENRKKLQVAMDADLHAKLADTAERYGIATNSLIVFILGQWIDENHRKTEMLDNMVQDFLKSPDDVLNNPELLGMIKEILSDDKDFKKNAAEKL